MLAAGKTFLAIQLMRVFMAATVNRQGDAEGALQARRPDVGPILVLCLTNHALDSFLEGLLDVGITSIVRGGSSAKTSERLKSKNLSEIGEKVSWEGWGGTSNSVCCKPLNLLKLSSLQAGGQAVGKLIKRRQALTDRLEILSARLAWAATLVQGGQQQSRQAPGCLIYPFDSTQRLCSFSPQGAEVELGSSDVSDGPSPPLVSVLHQLGALPA
jgi:hypothetical protein